MKLSLYILESWFKQHNYKTSFKIDKGDTNIVSFQISSVPLSANIGRICSASSLITESNNHLSSAIVSGQEYLIIHNITLEETLNKAYEAYEHFYAWETNLYQKITSSTSLQELLDITYNIFKKPMSICNSRGWDYAMSGGDSPYIHPLREEFVFNSNSNHVTDRQTFLMSLNSVEPVVIYSAAHKCDVLFANIWLDGKRSGAIVAYQTDSPFKKADLQIMNIFQNIITIYATINKGVLRSRSALSEYLIDVLNNKENTNYSISKILKYPNWKASDNYIILGAMPLKPSDSIFMNNLCDELEQSYFKPQTFIYDNKMIALINLKASINRIEIIKSLKSIINTDIFCWGLSHEFNNISNFIHYYPQIDIVLSTAITNENHICTMRDIATKNIRQHCTDDAMLQSMLHPDVKYLIDYDKSNHTFYANTLYCFLLFSCNYTDAANELNLHRNTLIYRINRISQLISSDFTNVHEREFLLLSFIIYKEHPAIKK